MDTDVIVVGAGPAGSTAAREISQRGHRVLLLDRAAFPRDKPCGGGISLQCAALLPFGISELVEQVISGFVFGDPRTGMVTRDAGHTIGYLTQRSRFDALLVERARDSGVDFRDDHLVSSIERLADGSFEVRAAAVTGTAVHRARALVGADGANGIVRTALGIGGRLDMGVALEGNLPCPGGIPEWLRGRISISLALVPGGYGWLFPKRDHINIGVGGRDLAGPLLRDAFEAYVRAFGWDPALLNDVRGHRLPMRSSSVTVTSGGAAVVGDAAGLVDPLSGGGIHGAVFSGGALAPAIHDYLSGAAPNLHAYERTLERAFVPGLRRARVVADLVYGWPTLSSWGLAHSRPAWWLASKLTRSGRALPAQAVTSALRPLAALGRRRIARRIA